MNQAPGYILRSIPGQSEALYVAVAADQYATLTQLNAPAEAGTRIDIFAFRP